MAATSHVVAPQGWWQLLNKVENRDKVTPCKGAGDASQRPGEDRWSGGSWHGALRMMRDGWKEGAQQVDAIMDTLPDAEALADAWNLEAAGRFPCVPAFLSGDPECMWQTSEMDGTKQRVCLIISACYNCGITADEVLRYGAAVGATLRALEAAGHGVAIYSIDKGSEYRGDAVAQACIVRDFGEPLDTSVVAFAFHPAFLRRILFANRELTEDWASRGLANHGYGHAREADLADAVACLGEFPACPVVLSGVETAQRLGVLREGKTDELLALFRTEVQKALAIM
jgi:hypothetical protein